MSANGAQRCLTDDETTDEGPEVNIRSLTRGDGVVIGAAVLLFIASFLNLYSVSGYSVDTNAWDNLGYGLGVYLGGVIGAALIVVNRCLPQPRKVLGLDLGTVGTAFTVLSAWTLFWSLVDVGDGASAAAGLILGFIAALVLVARPSRPRSFRPSRPRSSAPRPRSPRSPTAASRRVVTATREPRSPVSPVSPASSPTAPSPRSPRSRSAGSRACRRRRRRRPRPRTSRRSGSPFRSRGRCSVRTARRRRSPNWRRAPGTWPSSSVVRPWWRRRRTAVVVCFRTPRGSSAADPPIALATAPRPFRRGAVVVQSQHTMN